MKTRWKVLAVAGIVALMALDVWSYWRWRVERTKIGDLAEELGLTESDPEAVEEALKDPDSILARMWLARSLSKQVEAEIGDPARRGDLVEPLEHVYDIAYWVWLQRPVNCEAAAMAGSSRYLAWSLGKDRRLVTEAEAWEKPLQAARTLCGQDPSHLDFLGGAYLDLWFYLSDEKKELTKEIVREALQQSDRLAPVWLATISSRAEAWEALPPRPSLWLKVQEHYVAQAEWLNAIEARERWREVGQEAARAAMEHAEELIAKGERSAARRTLSGGVFRELPLERAAVPLAEQALALWPESPNPGRGEQVLRPWLDWSLELCRSVECPVSAAALGRLGELSPDLPEELHGEVLLWAGHRAMAEVLEPEEADPATWSSYFLTKARVALAHGDVAAAADALGRAGEPGRSRPIAWWLAVELDKQGLATSTTAIRLGPWRRAGPDWVQELAVRGELAGLALELPRATSLLEVELDGNRLGPFAPDFARRLPLPQSLASGGHRLVVRPLDHESLPAPTTDLPGEAR